VRAILLITFAFIVSFGLGCAPIQDVQSDSSDGASIGSGGSGGSGGSSSSGSCLPFTVAQQESSVCQTETSLSGPTLSGKATFQARKVSNNGLGAPGSAENIRYAEVQVFDSSGNRVQCGYTDANGNFSVSMPEESGSYEVRVSSRSRTSEVKVSVLQSPVTNEPHYISQQFTMSGSAVDVGTLNASATGTLEGGAFNIYNQIVDANENLRTLTSDCSTYNCEQIDTLETVTLFWQKGVNPTSEYFGQSGAGLSFYLPCQGGLYILGGDEGNVDSVDTDHFDNSVILHEYAHFIEDNYSISDSPGGAHDGNTIIDPRLAWSEGFANFFQALVTGSAMYIDTTGNISGSTGFLFRENIETSSTDLASENGEGVFREFAITRSLWDSIDPHPISGEGSNEGSSIDSVTVPFSLLWKTFSDNSTGFASSSLSFRNYALFLGLWDTFSPSSVTISSLLTAEKMTSTEDHYAVDLSIGSCNDVITMIGEPNFSSIVVSDYYSSNDFYEYTHSGGSFSATIHFDQIDPNNPTDIDVYFYQESHNIEDLSSAVTFNEDLPSQDNGTVTVSASSLPAGTYMLNIASSEDSLGSGVNYQIELNGSGVCYGQ
jgi:hypothetical protein